MLDCKFAHLKGTKRKEEIGIRKRHESRLDRTTRHPANERDSSLGLRRDLRDSQEAWQTPGPRESTRYCPETRQGILHQQRHRCDSITYNLSWMEATTPTQRPPTSKKGKDLSFLVDLIEDLKGTQKEMEQSIQELRQRIPLPPAGGSQCHNDPASALPALPTTTTTTTRTATSTLGPTCPTSTFVLLNAQGITPQATSSQHWKLPFLVDKLEEQRSDFIPFIGITETWLKSYITDSQIAIENYSSLRSDRHRIQRGSVLMYVHNSLHVSDVVTYDKGKCEAVMGTQSSINTILVTLYRPPGTSDEMFRELLLAMQQYLDNAMDRKHHDIYIMGDFNLPSIDWKTLADDHSQGQVRGIVPAQRLFDFMGTNFLTQIVYVPTREENTLDLVLTNCPHYIHEVQSEKLPISDHNLVSVTTGFDWRTPTSDRTGGVSPDPASFGALNCYEGDYQKMGLLLDEVNWERLRECCIDSGDDDGSMLMLMLMLYPGRL